MRFNPKARLDTSRVRDVGGSGGGGGAGGGGMRIPIPGGTKAGGGIGGVLIVILFLVLTQCMNNGGTGGVAAPRHRAGHLADGRHRHRPLRQLQDRRGHQRQRRTAPGWRSRTPCTTTGPTPCPSSPTSQFQPEAMQTFTGGTSTGCGNATAEVGPFYCPVDATIYLDTTFFEQVLQQQLNGPSGGVRRAVRAGPRVRPPHPEPARHHGPGHDPAGTQQRRGPAGAPGRLLRRHVGQERHEHRRPPTASRCCSTSPTRTSSRRSRRPRPSATTGSSSRPRGRVNKEQWTHGSAAARVKWFQTGFSEGTLQACDTFAPATVE